MGPAQQSVETPLVDFGQHYAVLNLDWMSMLIDAIDNTPEGKSFIANCSQWNDAVHAKDPRPMTVFTSLFFSNASQPELHKHGSAPFTKLVRAYHTFAKDTPEVKIDSRFVVDEKDIVLQKTRWYAGAGNALEQILKSQNIDTVIISGLSLSGVVMSTIYHLFDLDYTIYVISDNVVELPVDHTAEYSRVMLGSLLGKMHLKVISLEEAMEALERS